ncbi:MAG: hypothetical protein QGG54_03020 [Gammaproteobacteria bacterium]|jgi:hypothetical protein|nr:hypothetical protein [Gammaproteobacteria bacterium]MDP6653765.1 hypothetical protein [Gammaproteobacteria bacterium]|tara:strand:+ start:361 stop:564 length:204 start_codon:yes stop_codon:yes gene_type:complete
MAFDEETATLEELWEFYMGKCQNPNPVAKWLMEGFFSALGRLPKDLPQDSRILELGCGPEGSPPYGT